MIRTFIREARVTFAIVSAAVLVQGFAGPHAWGQSTTISGVDSHTHVISSENWQSSPIGIQGVIDGAIEGRAISQMLDAAEVDRAVLISGAYFFKDQEQARHENSFTAEQVREAPERFVGLCSVSALQPWASEELEYCVNSLGLVGLKLHMVADNMDLTNPEHLGALSGLLAKGAELSPGMPVLIDFNWTDDAQTFSLIQLAFAHPGANIVMAHGLGHHFTELAAIHLFRDVLPGGLQNLYMDISATLFLYPPDSPPFENYMWHLRRFGTDRILFGSDYPVNTTAEAREGFEAMGFSAEESEQILETNALRVFRFR